ncbi:MAG: SUMF1/EgtB/PvdO family nonheme iron enzyme [Spirochaetes bacterium]|nr:SUMF1/EgtB/PvdO family nonheme iron enzyme [Spirochaetota bacterium]
MRLVVLFALLVFASLDAANDKVIARVARIDPVTQIVEIKASELLQSDATYRVLGESGDAIGFARNLQKTETGTYRFTFEPKRRALVAGRRIALTLDNSSFSALADRPRASKPIEQRFKLNDDAPMRLIPEGPFVLGSQDTTALHFIPAENGGRVANRADVAAFFIDTHEVTVRQYIRHLQETRQRIPDALLAQGGDLPLTHATFAEAVAYCAWTGKRLPTELEWEKAARGTGIVTQADETYAENNSFPVSEGSAATLCVTGDNSAAPREVNKLTDTNTFGLVGMCGNAAEWTSSWLLPYRGNTNRDERFGKRYKVIRGGSYEHPLELAKSYTRLAGGIPSLKRDHRAGFRCARSE